LATRAAIDRAGMSSALECDLGFDLEIGFGSGAAQQHIAGLAIGSAERIVVRPDPADAPGTNPRLAPAAT
jgi:hypothetical protein